jgi:hypothetical protein
MILKLKEIELLYQQSYCDIKGVTIGETLDYQKGFPIESTFSIYKKRDW